MHKPRMTMYKQDYLPERDKDFIDAYYNTLSHLKGKRPRYNYLCLSAIHTPAQRFYVSEEAAIKNIRRLENGEALSLPPEALLMYIEIHKRFCRLLAREPLTRIEAVRQVIYAPAPRFYISVPTALRIISQSRKHVRQHPGHHRRKPATT